MLAAALIAAAIPVVGCAERAEPSPPDVTPARWIMAGPVAWPRSSHGATKRRGAVSRKLGLVVEAGPTVTVRVLTPGAALIYRQSTRLADRVRDADRALRFEPCAPDHDAFSGPGIVGPRTGFAGALIADRRKCIRVRVARDGRSWTARLPVGRRCR